MDKKRMEDAISKFDKAYFSDDLREEYLQFSRFIQGAFISPNWMDYRYRKLSDSK